SSPGFNGSAASLFAGNTTPTISSALSSSPASLSFSNDFEIGSNDRLQHFALVERTNNGSDHVHQFELLPFHVASEQALRIRSEFKKSAVKLVSELSTDRPDRVERLSDKLSLFRRHDANRRYQKSA